MESNKIFLSIDMDEWYHCRWATGSKNSMWPDTQTLFREYYNDDKPSGDIIRPAKRILRLFHKNKIKSTFFFTGRVASHFPHLVKEIVEKGHEIGCHNLIHRDYDDNNIDDFKQDLVKSKKILEEISDTKIIGYRAPNAVVSERHIPILIQAGFKYDSSITPTLPLFGKYGNFITYPKNPYRLSINSYSPGEAPIWEFPWPTLPILKLPAGSGITTRMFGIYYTKLALDNALRTGHTTFYFHPYEIANPPQIASYGSISATLQMRNLGDVFFNTLIKILKLHKGRFISGRNLLRNIES